MHEKHLLLPSAKSGVLVASAHSRRMYYARFVVVAVGLLCVLIGAADITTRIVDRVGGPDAGFLAFAPAAALQNPQALAPLTQGAIIPARLKIPALGVNAEVEPVGVKADGTMGTPQNYTHVSWYSLGAKPGQAGSAVFAGHVNNGLMTAGVFSHLTQIKKGDYLTVEDADGRSKIYSVASVVEYPANAPTDSIFATAGPEQLVLITCDGEWVPAQKTFDKRLVVIAKPAY